MQYRVTNRFAVLIFSAFVTGLGFSLSTQVSSSRESDSSSECSPLRMESPDHPIELEMIMANARKNQTPISLLGGGYSQGHQTCAKNALQINTREMNQLIHLDIEERLVTVQAGMTWARLQEQLEFFGLGIAAMQSYNDFTIGGSLGVNAHGQDVHWNPVSSSVDSIKVLLTDGRHLLASRTENPELFQAVIGSYGLIGIITEVTLKTVPNSTLQKRTSLVKTKDYNRYFKDLQENSNLALHSARLSINPLYRFRNIVVVNYLDTHELPDEILIKNKPSLPNQKYLNLLKTSWLARVARTTAEYFLFEKEALMTRNQAMGESVIGLKNTAKGTRDILQEYFVPPEKLQTFTKELESWVARNKHFTLINATIRWVNADHDTLLPYAPEDRFAVVLFINLPDTAIANQAMEKSTRELIDTTLKLKGRYYLPYALYASRDQFYQTYPEFHKLIAAKKIWDKEGLLTNQLYRTYGKNLTGQ